MQANLDQIKNRSHEYRYRNSALIICVVFLLLADGCRPDPDLTKPDQRHQTVDNQTPPQVSPWQAPHFIEFSRSMPREAGISRTFSEGVFYDDQEGNKACFLEFPKTLSLQYDSPNSGQAELTLVHQTNPHEDCETSQILPLAVLVNGSLRTTQISSRPTRTPPQSVSSLTIELDEGPNQVDLVASQACPEFCLQAVTLTTPSKRPENTSLPTQASLEEFDSGSRRAITRLATLHFGRGQPELARRLGQLAREAPGIADNPEWHRDDLYLQMLFAALAEDSPQVEALAKTLLKKDSTTGNRAMQFDAWNMLSVCYEETHRFDLAIDALKKCLTLESEDTAQQVSLRTRLVGLYFSVFQPMHAQEWALEALARIPKGQFARERIMLHFSLLGTSILKKALEPSFSEEPAKTAQLDLQKIWNSPFIQGARLSARDNPSFQSTFTLIEAIEHGLSGNYGQALKKLEETIGLEEDATRLEKLGLLHLGRAGCYVRLDRWDDAIEALNASIAYFNGAFEDITHPLVRATTSSISFASYYLLMQGYHNRNQPEASLFALETGRARTLEAKIPTRTPPANSKSTIQSSLPQLTLPGAIATEQLRQLIERITSSLPADRKVLFVEYALGDEVSFIFTVSPQAGESPVVTMKPLAANRPTIYRLVKRLRQRIVHDSAVVTHVEARQLADILLTPIASDVAELTPNDLLCIVPADVLWELPFGTLPIDEGVLADRQPICLAPSIRTLRTIRERPPVADEATVLAMIAPDFSAIAPDTLPAGLETLPPITETSSLVTAFSQNDPATLRLTEGINASESYFKQESGAAKQLFLITHGIYHEFDADKTGFYLAPDHANDGFLSVREILELNLRTELAFVAACHSGQGTRANGEGAIGLSWALLAAGADSTLVALHKVESANTFQLVQTFKDHYDTLKRSEPFAKALALYRARKELAADDEKRRALHLDGIVLVGDWQ